MVCWWCNRIGGACVFVSSRRPRDTEPVREGDLSRSKNLKGLAKEAHMSKRLVCSRYVPFSALISAISTCYRGFQKKKRKKADICLLAWLLIVLVFYKRLAA